MGLSARAELVLVAVTWLVTRAVVLSQTLSGQVPGDVAIFAGWAPQFAQGAFPIGDETFQYPPAAALIFLAAGTDPVSYYRRFTLVMLAFDLLILVLLVLAARRSSSGSSLGAWVWAVSAVVLGPLMLQRFDLAPTAFAVAGVLALSRPSVSGAIAGLGGLVKIWPGVVVLGLPRRHFVRGVVSALAAALAGWGLLALLFTGTGNFLQGQGGRGLEVESTLALPLLLLRVLGVEVGVHQQFGSWEVTHSLGSVLALASTVLLVVVFGGLVVLRLIGRLEDAPGGDVVLLAVLLFVALNKVHSPQFGVWVLGVLAAALASSSSRMRGVGLLAGLSVLVANQGIWPSFDALPAGNVIAVGLQVLRVVLLLAACGWATWVTLRRADGAKEALMPGSRH